MQCNLEQLSVFGMSVGVWWLGRDPRHGGRTEWKKRVLEMNILKKYLIFLKSRKNCKDLQLSLGTKCCVWAFNSKIAAPLNQ